MTSELPESPWFFSRVPGGYESRCPNLGITITAEEIKRKADEMTAFTTIRSTMVGVRTVEDDIVKIGVLNFYAPTSRATWAKEAKLRCGGETSDLDWPGFLERFVAQVVAAERVGEPLVELDKLELAQGNRYLIPGLVSAEETTIWFGDGGSMKSYLALAAAATIDTGSSRFLGVTPTERRRVGYVDWEWGAQAHLRRLRRLSDGGAVPSVAYIRCDRPLTHEVSRLQRLIRENRLGFLVLDSIAFGCDAPPEQADTATRYVSALRQLGVPCLALAHVTKAEDGDRKPFGSSFWHNSSRLTWFVKRAGESGEQATVGLFNRKNNDDGSTDPVAFRFWFQDAVPRTVISRVDAMEIADEPEVQRQFPWKDRIAAVLSRTGPLTPAEVASEMGVDLQQVIKPLTRNTSLFNRLSSGRYELLPQIP